jgi:holo-[acyl-carrier protein] synthase
MPWLATPEAGVGDRVPEASSVLGVGIDLVENERMDETLGRWSQAFKDRVFLPSEQAYCESKAAPAHHYAGRFAVKEAVSKAFGTGVGEHIGWLDIEVCRDERTGAPSIQLSEKGARLALSRGVRQVLISLSHTKNYSVAQAILLGNAKGDQEHETRDRRTDAPIGSQNHR